MNEKHQLGGITYLLTTSQYAKGVYGHWVCDKCRMAGVHPFPAITPKVALEQAKLDLRRHHDELHTQAAAPASLS